MHLHTESNGQRTLQSGGMKKQTFNARRFFPEDTTLNVWRAHLATRRYCTSQFSFLGMTEEDQLFQEALQLKKLARHAPPWR